MLCTPVHIVVQQSADDTDILVIANRSLDVDIGIFNNLTAEFPIAVAFDPNVVGEA